MSQSLETTEVVVCGCGPTGAMLSAYLGRAGIANIVLEKEAAITQDPRGIALDEDGIRLVQGLGLYDYIFQSIGTYIPRLQFVSGTHSDLQKPPFMCIDTSSTAGNTAHVGAMCHKQPELERCLRTMLTSDKSCSLRSSCTLVSVEEDSEWVYATYLDGDGARKTIRSKFLVGADGKTGFVRKNYLEKKGIQLQWAEGTKYAETWVALNWKITLPRPETHPSFPLWSLGYTPEQVYDAFFPTEFRFLCNPKRPAVCGRFGLQQDRLWRFEFVVAPGEDESEMAAPENIEKVVFPYITHTGSRYGLDQDVRYPVDCIEVLRCRPFQFSARSCDRWALGRVILCGDAAHVFPPFGGQGIASGFRDAIALSWRLAIACTSSNVNVEEAMAGWYSERKQQLEASLASTIKNGNMVNNSNPWKILVRDWGLWLLQMIPTMKQWIELGPRMAGRMRYTYEPGMAFLAEMGGGALFSQSFCVRVDHSSDVGKEIFFTDDVIFREGKKGLFQIIVFLNDGMGQRLIYQDAIRSLEYTSPRLYPHEATFFVTNNAFTAESKANIASKETYRFASAAEFAASPLSNGRPYPHGYREDDMHNGVNQKRFAIVRSDRVVFASCDTKMELEVAAKRLNELFPM